MSASVTSLANGLGNTPPEYGAPPLRATIPAPDLNALWQLWMGQAFNQLNCHQVGTVVKFYPANQTADIQPAMQTLVHDFQSKPPQWKAVAPPVLTGVPVFIYSGGGGTLTFPVATGDPCLLLFNDRDIGNWFSTGNVNTPPTSSRAHNISDGFALVGFRNLAQSLAGYSTTDAVLQNGGSHVSLGAKVSLANQSTSLITVLQDITTALSTLNAAVSGHPATGDIATANTAITALLKA